MILHFLSLSFVVFFILVLILYYIVKLKYRWIVLLIVSIVFYLFTGYKAIVFLLFSICTTYLAARIIACNDKQKSKFVLIITLILNIGFLFFLKYFINAIPLINHVIPGISITIPELIIPMGISFYTLQSAGYLIDVYREDVMPEKNFAKYALFISFFPHILQGPIASYHQLASQLIYPKPFSYDSFKFSLQLILWGCFKKMVIADRAGIIVDMVHSNITEYAGFELIITAILYSIQLYTDFSGFVDVSRGVAGAFGIDLAHNFNWPYFSQSIQEFWRRWHISLSTWLKKYVYIPLGGSRKGTIRKYLNILATFFVSGLWHGYGLSFIAWGLLHGAYQVIGSIKDGFKTKLQNNPKLRFTQPNKIFKIVTCFCLVTFAWIFFRAASLTDALIYIKQMFSSFNIWILFNADKFNMGMLPVEYMLLVLSIFTLVVIEYLQGKYKLREIIAKQPIVFRWLIYFISISVVIIFGSYGPAYNSSSFIYGNF